MRQLTAHPELRWPAGLLGIWLAVALIVSATGVLFDPPPPLLPAMIWIPPVIFLAAFARSSGLRQWIKRLNPRWPIGFHLVRAPIGVMFLLMEAAGRLPAGFAVKAGIGDIVVGTAAVVAMICVPLRSLTTIRVVLAWNILGLADILMVIVVAQRILFFGEDTSALVEWASFMASSTSSQPAAWPQRAAPTRIQGRAPAFKACQRFWASAKISW